MKSFAFKQICSFAIILFLLNTCVALSAELEIGDQEGTQGDEVTFNVTINNTPNELNSMEFNITYDSSILNFEGWEAGGLVSNFVFFNAAKLKGNEGVIKVAGFTSAPISTGISREIVHCTFNI